MRRRVRAVRARWVGTMLLECRARHRSRCQKQNRTCCRHSGQPRNSTHSGTLTLTLTLTLTTQLNTQRRHASHLVAALLDCSPPSSSSRVGGADSARGRDCAFAAKRSSRKRLRFSCARSTRGSGRARGVRVGLKADAHSMGNLSARFGLVPLALPSLLRLRRLWVGEVGGRPAVAATR